MLMNEFQHTWRMRGHRFGMSVWFNWVCILGLGIKLGEGDSYAVTVQPVQAWTTDVKRR